LFCRQTTYSAAKQRLIGFLVARAIHRGATFTCAPEYSEKTLATEYAANYDKLEEIGQLDKDDGLLRDGGNRHETACRTADDGLDGGGRSAGRRPAMNRGTGGHFGGGADQANGGYRFPRVHAQGQTGRGNRYPAERQ